MQTLLARSIENPIVKDRLTFLKTSAETGGAYTSMLLELAPNGYNEPHSHRSFDEVFTVLKGQLGMRLENQTFILEPGETARVKAGATHSFFNPSATEKAVAHVMLDNGNTGMEISLQVAYGLARDGRTTLRGIPKNLYHLACLIHWSDTNLPRFLRFLEPMFCWLHARARQKGIDRQLILQYAKI